MASLGLQANDDTGDKLIHAYAEPHRHYHTTRHLEDCLQKLDHTKGIATDANEVELALWFHDAIYKPMAGGNEEASANWASEFLTAAGASADRVQRVHDLIMATQHAVPASTGDTKLLVDIDLSILGESTDIYGEFEKNVRKEYRWVPYFMYRKKRREILESFLTRSRIYETEPYFDRYESRARENLENAVARL